jgi:hypothetical protein
VEGSVRTGAGNCPEFVKTYAIPGRIGNS